MVDWKRTKATTARRRIGALPDVFVLLRAGTNARLRRLLRVAVLTRRMQENSLGCNLSGPVSSARWANSRRSLPMKRMRNWIVVCAALLMIGSVRPVFAATDVTGTWTTELKAPDGSSIPITFNFKQDGAKLTGTVTGDAGPVTIDNGKIDGNKMTFTVSFSGITISHDGTIDGDVIKLSTKTDSDQIPPMDLVLKRAPATPKQ